MRLKMADWIRVAEKLPQGKNMSNIMTDEKAALLDNKEAAKL